MPEKKMPRQNILLLPTRLLFLIAILPGLASAQQETGEPESGDASEASKQHLATVKGQFTFPAGAEFAFEMTSLQGVLVQMVPFRQPELPPAWQTMTPEQRREWIDAFEQSEEGKKLLAENEALDKERAIIEFDIDRDGHFVAYDVPPGPYQLEAGADLPVDGALYVVQAFGQLEVGKVDEVVLGAMPLEVIRFLRNGESAPVLKGPDCNGNEISLEHGAKSFVLVNFVSVENQAFPALASSLRETASMEGLSHELRIFSVAVDANREAACKRLAETGAEWPCLALGKWDTAVLHAWGVQSVPSLWLTDPEGRIVVTGQQFVDELSRGKRDIRNLVEDVMAGRLKFDAEGNRTDSEEAIPEKDPAGDGLKSGGSPPPRG